MRLRPRIIKQIPPPLSDLEVIEGGRKNVRTGIDEMRDVLRDRPAVEAVRYYADVVGKSPKRELAVVVAALLLELILREDESSTKDNVDG